MRARAAILLGAGALAAGCGGGDGRAPAPRESAGTPAERPAGMRPSVDLERIRGLLARRAAALEEGDAAAYAATATGARRGLDRRAARRARALPLRDVQLHLERVEPTAAGARLRVLVRYGLRGVAGGFTTRRRLDAVRTARGWRIRSESGGRERHPWELGTLAVARTRHFLVLAPAGLGLGGLPADLEAGYARLRARLGRGALRRRYLVQVAGDAETARRLTSGVRGVAALAAISASQVREQGSARRVSHLLSQRVLVVWPRFAPLDAGGRRQVVAHELTHAVLARTTSGRTPAWLVEGVALWVSGDRRVEEAARLLRDASLSRLNRPDAIARLSGVAQSAAYAYSSAAVFYLHARFGRRRLLALYDAFNDEAIAGRSARAVTEAALRRTLGIGLARLERDLRRWVVERTIAVPRSP